MDETGLLAVKWRDLVAYKRWEILKELSLPFPWLFIALGAGALGWYWLAIFCSFFVFMTGLRIAHNAFHATLGISKPLLHLVMFLLSMLMIGSTHAIRYTHLKHHRDCLADDDVEGQIAKMGFWRALMHSPIYPLLIHIEAIKHSPKQQRNWVFLELVMSAVVQYCIWGLCDIDALKLFSATMIFSNSMASMVGIWAVHRACANDQFKARTSRSRVLNLMVVGMFNHLEHHLYPGVPTCHLGELAKRLDAAKVHEYKMVY